MRRYFSAMAPMPASALSPRTTALHWWNSTDSSQVEPISPDTSQRTLCSNSMRFIV